MKAIVSNQLIVLQDVSKEELSLLRANLTYSDKAVKYKLRRLSKNPHARNSPYYKKLQQEAEGCLLYRVAQNAYAMSSGFYSLLLEMNANIIDNRCDTGTSIPLPWKNKPPALRDYQEEAVQLMESNYRGVINFATGLGKTLLSVHLIRRVGRKTLVVAPSESIAKQFYGELVSAFGESKVGMFGGGKRKVNDITVGIAASVNNHIEKFKAQDLGLVIIDETHHTPASTFYSISKALGGVGKMFGLTATDYRSDGKDVMIVGGCGSTLIRRDIKWGIQHGWLAVPRFIVKQVDTTHMKNFRDDKIKNYKEHVLSCNITKKTILEDIQYYVSEGKSVLCLVAEIEHGEELSTQLGIPFATGKDKQSQEYVDMLNAGKIKALIGTDGKISEGTDTRNVDVLILANFVASKGPVIQAVGRGLRKQDNKTCCLIVDYWLTGSDMLSRHAEQRVEFYKEITDDVKVVVA